MACNTSKALRGQIVYSVFTRNYSREGTFEAVRKDLDRIKALGTDIIWLMPIHPSGKEHRKGSLGSPYAIQNYRAVDPAQGTLEDFKRLTDDIHARGMKCIIDVVYHHTSPDSWLAQHHPEWFFHKADGSFGNQVGDWWDVIDLDFNQKGLWDYLIETLKMWAEYVDGFRCDVASMVPVEFWKRAREEVAQVRPDAIWLAESVEGPFVAFNRSQGIYCASDSEVFQAFDMSYEYDVADSREAFLKGEGTLERYLDRLNLQEEIYPDNYDKLRFLENHDRRRAHDLIPDERQLRNWTAFLYLQKGTVLIYNGQEKGCTEQPTLFDADPIAWTGHGENGSDLDLTEELKKLAVIKKTLVPADASFHAEALSGDVGLVIQTEDRTAAGRDESARRQNISSSAKPEGNGGVTADDRRHTVLGVFALGREAEAAELAAYVDLPDGSYVNELTGETVSVQSGTVLASAMPLIIKGVSEPVGQGEKMIFRAE